jgi:hypothetical protein
MCRNVYIHFFSDELGESRNIKCQTLRDKIMNESNINKQQEDAPKIIHKRGYLKVGDEVFIAKKMTYAAELEQCVDKK